MIPTYDDSIFDNNGSDVIPGVGNRDKLSNTGEGGGDQTETEDIVDV